GRPTRRRSDRPRLGAALAPAVAVLLADGRVRAPPCALRGARRCLSAGRTRGGRRLTAADARRLALALPEAVEQDHHGRPSFRVQGKIFATLWDDGHMNVMLDEGGILTAVQAHPGVCAEVWWGKRLAGLRVDLPLADERLLAELLEDAWEGKSGGLVQPEFPR